MEKDKKTINKKKLVIIIVICIISLILLIGISYAYFFYNFTGTDNVIEVDQVELELLESNSNIIEVTNALPANDKQGIDQEETFDFAVTSNTSRETDISYEIYIEELAATSGYTKLNRSDIRVYLTDFDGNIVTGPLLISDLSNMVLTRGEHSHNKNNVKIQDKYKLRTWIDEDVDISNWNQNTKLEYKFKIGVRTTDYVTPEECFNVTGGGLILSYNCGNKTEGSEKHYDLVIPKTFSKVYTTLNEEDQAKIVATNIYTEEEVAQCVQEAENGNYINFNDMLLNYYLHTGANLTTEKQPLRLYTSLNETDVRNMTEWAKSTLGMSEEEINNTLNQLNQAAANGDYDEFNYYISMYIQSGGAVTSEKTEIQVKPIKIGHYAFYNEGLTTVYMPDTITHMYWSVFSDNNINHIKLSNNLKYFGEYVLSSNKLTSILIHNSTSIDMSALSNNDLRIVQLGTSPNTTLSISTVTFIKNNESNPKLFRIINKTGEAKTFEFAVYGKNNYDRIESGIIKNDTYGDVEVTLE